MTDMATGFRSNQHGLSYIEVMVATLLLTIALVPMMDALQPGLQGAQIHRQQAETHFALSGKLEQVLAQSFDDLDAAATTAGGYQIATSYSDLAAAVPHQVFIWRYDVDDADNDGDVFTGGEADMLWIRVATADSLHALETLRNAF